MVELLTRQEGTEALDRFTDTHWEKRKSLGANEPEPCSLATVWLLVECPPYAGEILDEEIEAPLGLAERVAAQRAFEASLPSDFEDLDYAE